MANNTLLASDNFQRANGALGANWTAGSGNVGDQIVSNQAQPSALSTNGVAFWSAISWPNDHCSEITLGTGWTQEVNTYAFLFARMSSSAQTWYNVNIGNGGQLFVARTVAGAQTQIGSLVTGLTFAAGDVISLQVAGPVISVYQNYNRIFYNTDFTITSGSPGFGGFSSVNAAHAAVASWRGYNTVQQDGIWQKQGIVLPLTAADVASSGFGVLDIAAILYEGNAQLLSGTVYKMWFTGGGLNVGNPGSTFYAESLDAINWTRRGTAVISGIACEALTKSGNTYFLYAQTGTLQGTGPILVYTSTDGITWTLANSSALTVGTAGQWDDAGIYALSSPVIVAGTWNMLYTGTHTNALFKVGLATSPDGINWTKYVSNPVLSNAVPGPVVKVGTTYYMWVAAGPSSPQLGSGNIAFDPTETVRYQSTDLINWTNPVRSVHHTQMFEGVNNPQGACSPYAIIDVGGKAYLFLNGSPSDGVAPQDYQIELAIAPSNIAAIVGFKEDATVQVATDAFARGAGGLGANWTTPTGSTALQIVSGNKVEATTTNAYNSQGYTGSVFGNDQYSEITVAATAINCFLAPAVRVQTGVNSLYLAQFTGAAGSLQTTSATMVRIISGVASAIGPTVAATVNLGDVFRLSAVGNVLTLTQNGAVLIQVQDVSNALTSGSPGMSINTPTLASSQISAWAGGNANVIPTYPSLIAWLNRQRSFVNKR